MYSISDRNMDNIILRLSIKYGVSHKDLVSMTNSVFKFFLRKITDIHDRDIINMPGLGRFYLGQVAIRNKNRWAYISSLIETKLKTNNISYEIE